MNKLLDKIVYFFCGDKCKFCGKRDLDFHKRHYSRGWNNLCQQASGDYGYYCSNCNRVNFVKTLEEYKSTLPDWCTPGKN